jgi:hypothetical protein
MKAMTALTAGLGALLVLLAPHAVADTNSYLDCLNHWYGITGNSGTLISLGREALDTARAKRAAGDEDNFIAWTVLGLQQKYGMSFDQAHHIVICAWPYLDRPPS